MKKMITYSPEPRHLYNMNDAVAQFELASGLLKSEQKTGIRKAFELFGKLAEQSCTPVQTDAQYMRGKCYENGYGCRKNYQRAILWYEKAAYNTRDDLRNHPNPVSEALIEAVFNTIETQDEGFDKGLEEVLFGKITPESIARKTKAAEDGDVDAQKYLMDLYDGGAGYIEYDQSQSAYWAERAAENGDVKAMHKLGNMYDYGRGVGPDCSKALYWWKKAAAQGSSDSALCIGRYFKSQEQYKEAVKWYRLYAELMINRRNNRLGRINRIPVAPNDP